MDVSSLAEVATRLDSAGVRWAVFAGAAAMAYGATRPLTDVDILVPSAEGRRVASLFPEGRITQGAHGALRITLPGFDILAGLGSLDLDAPMAERLTQQAIAGVVVPVIPAEDNILLKATWGRGMEEGKHDWEDVEAMMVHTPVLDWVYLRWRAGTVGEGDRMVQVFERLEELQRQLKLE